MVLWTVRVYGPQSAVTTESRIRKQENRAEPGKGVEVLEQVTQLQDANREQRPACPPPKTTNNHPEQKTLVFYHQVEGLLCYPPRLGKTSPHSKPPFSIQKTIIDFKRNC